MKISDRYYFVITTLVFSSLLMGCDEGVYYDDSLFKPSLESHYLSVNPKDFKFTSNGGGSSQGLIVSGNPWKFTGLPSWLSASPMSGNSDAYFKVTSSVNESTASRTAVFYLSASASDWTQQRILTASQTAVSPYFLFDLETTSIYLTGEAQTLTIDVQSNIDDLVPNAFSGSSWMDVSYQDNRLTISVSANDSGNQRSGRVQLWSSSCSKGGSVYITQYRADLSFEEITSLSFDAEGGSQSIDMNSDIPWFASSEETWIGITPSAGEAGSNQVKINVLPSYQSETRSGKVLFYHNNNQSDVGSVSILQTGRYLNISQTDVTISAEENSSVTVDVDSNIGWEVSASPEWLSADPVKGNIGDSKITLTAQKNNSLNSRSGTFTIKDSMTGAIEISLSIVQDGLDFGDQTTLEFGWQSSTQMLTVPIPNKWNAAVSEGWITMSQYTGIGETTCEITVSRNDSQNARTGQIVFSSEGHNITVSVVQNGQYITIDAVSGEISAMGGTAEIHIDTSVDIVGSIEYEDGVTDWINYENESDNSYRLAVKYNPSTKQRSATFVLTPKDDDVMDDLAGGVRFKIKQLGRDLLVEPSRIDLFAKGGTTETYPIIADGTYSIEKPDEYTWFTLVHDSSSNMYYIVATENKAEFAREGSISVSLSDLPVGEKKMVIIKVLQNSIYDSEISYEDYDDEEIL